jgi:hypothetical protein
MIGPFNNHFDFLSNFYPVVIKHDGIIFRSAEHAFQAAKSPHMDQKLRIASAETPGQAKKIGKVIECRPDWEQIKVRVMLDILRIKFSDPILAGKLVSTGSESLVEINTWGDTFWGMCNFVGKNKLGKLLMKVRCELSGDPGSYNQDDVPF